MLSLDSFLAREASLQKEERVPRVLVYENGRILVTMLGQLAFQLRDQSQRIGFKLVHGHHLSWSCCSSRCFLAVSFDPPGSLGHFSVLISCTKGLLAGEQFLGKLSHSCQVLDPLEWKLSQTIMPPEQFIVRVK